MAPIRTPEKEEVRPDSELKPAQSLEEAANSGDTLQGYAAMNDVGEETEIAREAAGETAGSHEEIALLAYQYYLERGGAHGSHEEDWHRAERELRTRRS